MKIWELATGIHIPLSNEENDLLEALMEDDTYALNERDEVVAQRLVSRGVFNRIDEDTGDKYVINYHVDSWRD